jgi:gluconate 5-dehydrogenase
MTSRAFDLAGRKALVTGSTRGLGRAIAEALAEAGATVGINGRDPVAADAVASTITGAFPAAFDVTDDSAVAAAASEVGAVDVLVLNAGTTIRKALDELSLDDWRQVLDLNLTSAFVVARAFSPAMIARGSGKIVTVCSVMSELARETTGVYAAAKGGLKMLTRSMCADWGRHGIQANGVAPGFFRTELTAPLVQNAEFDAWLRRRVPAGRWGEPEELGGAVVFLASRASDFVNGQILFVDGGLSAVV